MPDVNASGAPPQNAWSPEGKFLIPPQVLQQIMAAQLATARPPPRQGPIGVPGAGGSGGGGRPIPQPGTMDPNLPPGTMAPNPTPPPSTITPTPAPGAQDAPLTMNQPGLGLPAQPNPGGNLGGDLGGLLDQLRQPALDVRPEIGTNTVNPTLSAAAQMSGAGPQGLNAMAPAPAPAMDLRAIQEMLASQAAPMMGPAGGAGANMAPMAKAQRGLLDLLMQG